MNNETAVTWQGIPFFRGIMKKVELIVAETGKWVVKIGTMPDWNGWDVI